jgi:hypothetical protein
MTRIRTLTKHHKILPDTIAIDTFYATLAQSTASTSMIQEADKVRY